MTSLTGADTNKDLKQLMQQIIDERDAKFAPTQKGDEVAPTGSMFNKPEVKSEEGDAIIDLLGYLEQKRAKVLESYQSKVMRRSSKPLPKPEDVDVSSFLSEAGLSPTSVADPLTLLSSQAPELGKPSAKFASDNFIMDSSKEPAKPMLSGEQATRESLPVEELTSVSPEATGTGSGLMSPNTADNLYNLTFKPFPDYESVLLTDSVDRTKILQKAIGVAVDGIFGPSTKKNLTKWQLDNNLEPTGQIDIPTINTLKNNPAYFKPPLTTRELTTGLTISEGTRADWKPQSDMYNISLDYNSSANGVGTEVIIPDNASSEVRSAAEYFNSLVVDFANSKGYTDYKNRGVKTRSQNQRGVSNTIHVEPFFRQDAKMEKIILDNMDEFSLLYPKAFGGLSARMIAPHGKTNSRGIQDKGATSKTFGTELDFGNMIIAKLLGE